MEIVHKATARAVGSKPLEYIMSDGTVDRYGDVVEPSGWKLKNFANNPIALFGHDSTFPVGEWRDVRVEGGALKGSLELLPVGKSVRVDEIRAFVEAGMLRAVSVGFHPIDAEPIPNSKIGGTRFKSAELVECSLVCIPANPNALQVAKSLNLSREAKEMIFGESADEIIAPMRRNLGETAAKPLVSRNKSMPTLSQRIQDTQTDLTTLRDNLSTAIDSGGDIDAITGDIEQKDAALASLKRAEKALGNASDPANSVITLVPTRVETRAAPGTDLRRPFATPAAKVAPADYVFRAVAIQMLAHVHKKSPDEIRQRAYGDDESTKVVFDHVTKAATVPATTGNSGWASQLVQIVNADFMDNLLPTSIYPGLSERGLRLTFGRNGVISIPSRLATPTIAGSFVGEGAPIPVRQGAFTSQQLTSKKMAVISTFSREIGEYSIPAIEGLLREQMQFDTAVSIDTVLLDTNAATSIRPAGIRNGVTALTATTGGGLAALIADAKALVTGLITATNGNIRAPVWIMNPVQAVSISLMTNVNGAFVFQEALNAGTFLGYPVIQSPTAPAGTVTLVDAADFVSVTGDDPRFDVSDQATLHMEDSAPQAIGTTGTPNIVAAPVRSLFQTDSLGIRMILPMNWTLRRVGVLAWVSGVTW